MLTSAKRGKPRQSWLGRLWPFPVVRSGRTENPRVGGSTPSQATTPQQLSGVAFRRLVLHFEHAAGGLIFLVPFIAPAGVLAQGDPWSPPSPSARPLHEATIDAAWMAGAAGVDLASTEYAGHYWPDFREANPWMQTSGRALAVKAGATAAGGWLCYELRKHGHPKGARWLRWGIVAVWSGAAINNLARAR